MTQNPQKSFKFEVLSLSMLFQNQTLFSHVKVPFWLSDCVLVVLKRRIGAGPDDVVCVLAGLWKSAVV